jgi:DNA primase
MAAMRAVATTAISMGMAVKVADIEGGKDPADLIRSNPEDWKEVLRTAKHVVEYELGNVVNEIPKGEKLARAIRERVFPYLARMDSAMDQAHFIKMIADRAHIAEDAVWQDLRAFEKTIKVQQPAAGQTSSTGSARPSSSAPHPSSSSHVDLVERRMMGLLTLLEKVGSADAPAYRENIKSIAKATYDALVKKTEPIYSDLQFEAEAFFGTDQTKWSLHMKELLVNYEEHIIAEELIRTMHELRAAEKAGDSARMGELAKQCHELSMRKAEVGKKRRG